MKLRYISVFTLILSLPFLLATGSTFADCEIAEPIEDTIPFTYDDHEKAQGVRATRLYSFRVGGVVSTVDAQKLLDAATLGHLDPDADGNGEATIWFHAHIDDVNQVLLPGDECDGVVFGPRNMYFAFMYAFNPNRGRVEIPLFTFLTDGEPFIVGPKEAVDQNARFEFKKEQKHGRLRLESEVESEDRQFYLKMNIEIPANTGFNLSQGNLYKANIPLWYASLPYILHDPLWINYYRLEYPVQPGDGNKVQITPRRVCFNQLSKATGLDLCVKILRAEGGAVIRREEAYNYLAPDK